MAMGNEGVRVKVIETQFVSSDAASFKAVVQRLTGKSPPPHRPQPGRDAGGGDSGGASARSSRSSPATDHRGRGATAEASAGVRAPPPPCLEELHELCEFSELFYVAASDRGGGGARDFPYGRV